MCCIKIARRGSDGKTAAKAPWLPPKHTHTHKRTGIHTHSHTHVIADTHSAAPKDPAYLARSAVGLPLGFV